MAELVTLGLGELVFTVGTHGVARENHAVTCWALLAGSISASAARARRLDLQFVNRTMPPRVVAVVENQAIGLAGKEPEPSPDHLVKQARRHRRTEQNHAIDVRGVESSCQDVDVHQKLQRRPGQHPELLTLESCQQFRPVGRRCLPRDDPAFLTARFNRIPDVFGMFDARGEDQHRATISSHREDLADRCRRDLVLIECLL